MNYLGFGKSLTLTNEELCEAVNNEMEQLDAAAVTDMILKICRDSDEREPGLLSKADPIAQITYIGREMYKLGFMFSMYIFNDALKEQFKAMQQTRDAREDRRKGVSCLAEA